MNYYNIPTYEQVQTIVDDLAVEYQTVPLWLDDVLAEWLMHKPEDKDFDAHVASTLYVAVLIGVAAERNGWPLRRD